METLVNQFKSFLLELPSSRQGGKKGLSKVSVKNYLSDIRRFLDWLSQYQPQISSAVPQRLSSDHFQAYLDFLTHQDLPHSTISRHFSSLRRFATFIEIVYHQPPLIIPTITSPDSTPKAEPTSIQTSSPNLLSSFSQYLKDQQKSASTVRNYLSDIRHFLAWVDQHPDLKTLPSAQQLDSSLESDVVDQYSHYLELTNTPSSTSSRRLSSLNIFTQFATNQGLVTPKTKPETSSPRLKPIPALSWLKPKTSSRPGFNLNLPNFIQKPITRLTSSPAYRSYHQLPFTPYLHLALLVLFTSAFALFGFRQIIIQSERISAYPSTPNRPTRQLSFQGRLTDSSGTPIVTPINATFKLWDQETGGTQGTCSGGAGEDCLYSTTTCSVDPDQDGIFNVLLGDGVCGSEIPADVFTENTAVWLEVEVATETLTPRQPIATVAYALNSETVSGIPVSASGSATVNTLFFMNSSGEIVLGEQNPSIVADSGNFTLQGEALTLSTTALSEGDITIAPDGIGQVNFIGGTTTDDFIRVVNANLTTGSLISGYVGNNNNTGELLRLSSGSSETDRFIVTTGGQTTIDALALGKSAFVVNQLSSGPIFTASASGTPKFTINNSGTVTLANNSILADDTNYARFSRGIAVGSNETYYFNASGNINANNLTLSGTTTLNGLTYTWPSTQSSNYVLTTNGSGTLTWSDPTALAASTIYWTQANGAVYPKNATVDLLVGGNSTASAIFSVNSSLGSLTLKDSSLNTLFSVSPSGLVSNVPSSFTSSGNVSFAYDLLLTNQTSSSIKSNAPLTIEAGESFESNDLTLKTYNQGSVVINSILAELSGGLSVTNYATISSSLALGTSSAPAGVGHLNMSGNLNTNGNLTVAGTTTLNGLTYTWPGSQTNNYVLSTNGSGTLTWVDPAAAVASTIYWTQSGGALYPKNATVDLLIGSNASSSAIFRVDTSTGNLISVAGSKWMPRSDSTTALNIANTAGTSFVTFDTTNQRVGIGTTSPQTKLHVSGEIRAPKINKVIVVDGTTYPQTCAGINAAIDALGSAGGEIYLPEGTYTCNETITIDNGNTTVRGAGWGTIIDASSSDAQVISGASSKNYITIRDLKIVGNPSSTNPNMDGIVLSGESHTFDHIWITNTKRHAIRGSLTNTLITNSFIENTGGWGIAPTLNTRITNNRFNNNTYSIVFYSTTGATGTIITNNTFGTDTTDNILTYSAAGFYYSNIIISSNTFNDGVSLAKLDGNVSISNNTFNNGNLSLSTTAEYNPTVSIASNSFKNASYLSINALSNTAITGNSFSGTSGYGIYINGDTDNVIVANNVIRDRTTGISIASALVDNTTIENNKIFGATTNIANTGTNTQVIRSENGKLAIGNITPSQFFDVNNQFVVTSSGLTGIGTTSPGEKLDISGNLKLSGTTTLNSLTYTWPSTQSTNYVLSTNGSGTLSWVDPAAAAAGSIYWTQANGAVYPKNATVDLLVGGNSTASAKFAFLGVSSGTPTASISGTTANVATYLTGEGNLGVTNMAPLTLGGASTGSVQLSPKGTTGLFITGNGRVGIGTTNPTETLHVNGNIRVGQDSVLVMNGGTTYISHNGNTWLRPYYNGGYNTAIYTGYDGTTPKVVITAAGNLGIGATSPISRLHVVTSDTSTTGKSVAIFDQLEAQDIFTASSSGTPKFTINNSGNISLLGGVAHSLTDNSGNLTLTSNSSTISLNDNVTFAGTTTLNSLTYTWPSSHASSGYVLSNNGSGSLTWIDPAAAAAGSIYWLQSGGAVYPKNATVDLLVGGNSTSSAKFAVLNMNTGTPTASISGTTANVAAYLTGEGNLQTTNRANLNLAGATTGQVNILDRTGFAFTTFDTLNGRVGIGTSSPVSNFDIRGKFLIRNSTDVSSSTTLAENYQQLIHAGVSTTDLEVGIAFHSSSSSNDQTPGAAITTKRSGTYGTGHLIFKTKESPSAMGPTIERMRITDNGNLGINTTSPSEKLDVAGNATVSGNLTFIGSASTIANRLMQPLTFGDSQTGNLQFYSSSNTLSSSGNLTLAGNINLTSGNLQTGGTTRLTNAGNLTNIGTTQFNSLTYSWPSSHNSSGYVLSNNGSGTLTWVDPATAAAGSIYWTQANGAVYPKNATVDLLVGGNSTASAIFSVNSSLGSLTLKDSSLNTLFSVSPSGLISNVPSSFTSSGNVSFAYDLLLTNQTSSSIKSNAPLTIEAGESFESNDLTLKTYNQGSVVINSILAELSGGLSVTNYATISSSLALGTSSAPAGVGHLNMSGNLNTNGNLTVAGTTTLGGLTYTWPGSQTNNYVLSTNGSGTLSWVDANNAAAGSIYWTQTSAAVHPKNSTVDLLVGGNATSSAKFAVLNINSGTPTASISGTTANVATYLTGEGNLAATNMAPLTIGGSTTGSLILDENTTITGNLALSGNEANLTFSGTGNHDITASAGTLRLGAATLTGAITGNSQNITGLNNLTGVTSTFSTSVTTPLLTNAGNLTLSATGDNNILFSTNGTERWRVTNTGILQSNGAQTIQTSNANLTLATGGGNGHVLLMPNGTGNVGVNTTSPTARLDIAGTASLSGTLAFRGTTDPKIDILNGENFSIRTSSGGDTGLSERLSVLSNGNLGIGTTSPSSLLSVGSSSQFQVNSSGIIASIDGVAHTIDDVSGNLTLTSNSSTISLNDNVTFAGTTTLNGLTYTWPSSQTNNYVLSTNGSGTLSWVDPVGAAAGAIYWNQSGGALYPKNATVDLLIGSNASSSAIFRVDTSTGNLISVAGSKWMPRSNSTTALNIANASGTSFVTFDTTNQRVGIKTASPNYTLDIAGNAYLSSYLYFPNHAGPRWTANSSAARIISEPGYSGVYNGILMEVNSIDGSQTKTTVQSWALDLGGTRDTLSKISDSFTIKRLPAGGSTWENLLTLKSTGNLGIGTTSPSEKLDVAGNATVSGNLTFTGSSSTIANRLMQPLTIGDSQTGNLQFFSSSNTLSSSGNLTLTGNINLTSGDLQTGGTSRLTNAGNLTNIGTTQFNSLTYTWPASHNSSGYVLSNNGSGTLTWVDPAAAAAGSIYWLQSGGAVYPKNATVDLLIGGNSTASAKFAINSTLGSLTLKDSSLNTLFSVSPSGLVSNVPSSFTSSGNVSFAYDLLLTNQTSSSITSNAPLTIEAGESFESNHLTLKTYNQGNILLDSVLTQLSGGLSVSSYATISSSLALGTSSAPAGTGHLSMSGNLSADGDLTVGGTTTLGGQTYTWPSSHNSSGYVLSNNGSGTLTWVDPAAAVASTIYWTQTAGALHPKNATVDLLVGSNATASAIFRVDATTGNLVSLAGSKWMPRSDSTTALNIANAAGTSFVTFDTTNQRVGIGTSSPAVKFVVQQSSGTLQSRIENTSASGRAIFEVKGNSAFFDMRAHGTTYSETLFGMAVANTSMIMGRYGKLLIGTYENEDFIFGTNNTERIRILNTGNVGIGTTSPTEKLDISGNLKLSGTTTFNGLTYTWPSSQSSNYVLSTNGSGTLSWSDPAALAGSTIYWTQNNGALYPKNATVDLLVGGSATTSAKFAVLNINTGTPTASISGTTANVATYLTGNGNLQTTNMAPLTLGGSTTGSLTLDEDTAITGNLSLAGTTGLTLSGNEADLTFSGTGNHDLTASAGTLRLGAATLTGNITGNSQNITGLNNLTGVTSTFSTSVTTPLLTNAGNLTLSATGANNLLLSTNGTERWRVTSTGVFQSSGAQTIQTSTGNLTLATAGGNGHILLMPNGTGYLGINTTSPASLLSVGSTSQFQVDSTGRLVSLDGVAHIIDDVAGNLSLTSNSTTISLNDNVTFAGTTTLNGLTYTWPSSQSSNYVLSTNGSGTLSWVDPAGASSGAIYWSQSGGALYPKNATVDLLVGGSASASAIFRVDATTGNLVSLSGAKWMPRSDSTTALNIANASGTSFVTFDTTNQRVGIGTSAPAYKLDIAGDFRAGNTWYTSYNSESKLDWTGAGGPVFTSYLGFAIQMDNDNNDANESFRISTNGNQVDLLVINADGNVGIGDATPASLLTVGDNDLFQINSSGNIINLGGAAHSISNSSGNLTLDSAGSLILADTNIQLSGGSTTLDVYNNAADTNLTLSNSSATYRANFSLEGQLQLGNFTSNPTSIGEGSLIYRSDTGQKVPYYWNGANWTQLATGAGGNLWTSTDTLIYPTSYLVSDLAIGGNSTASAKFFVDHSTGAIKIADSAGTDFHTITNDNNNLKITAGSSGSKVIIQPDLQINGGDILGSSGSTRVSLVDALSLTSISGFLAVDRAATISATIASDMPLHLKGASGQTANYLAITSNGGSTGDVLTVLNNGNVGIGDTTPNSLLTVGNNDLFQINSSGNIISLGGVAHSLDNNGGNLRLTSNSNTIELNDNVTFAGTTTLNGLTYTWPSSQTTNYVLSTNGSGTLSWINPTSFGSSHWSLTNGALYPNNATADLLIGGDSTASAKFAFIVANTGSNSPTASVSGNLALTVPTGSAPAATLNILNGGDFNLRTSVGGDAELTSRLYISNDGNFGFNDDSPATFMEITKGGDWYTTLHRSGASADAYYWGIRFSESSDFERFKIRVNSGQSDRLEVFNASNVGVYLTNGGTSWTGTSDLRLKENVNPVTNILNKLQSITTYTFNLKDNPRSDLGLIAQELYPLFPEVVDTTNEYWGINYDRLGAIALGGLKEQYQLFQDLRLQNDTLTQKLNQLSTNFATQDLNLTEFGDLNLATTTTPPNTTQYSLSNSLNQAITRLGAFSKAIIADLTVGRLSSQELISPLVEADQVITNTLTTTLIKPQPDSDLILSLNNQSATTPAQLLITDSQDHTIASLDSAGNATLSGELTATSAKFDSLEVGSLKANQIEGLTDTLSQIKSASEAARLFLDRLTAKHSAQDESLNVTAQQLVSTSSSQLLSTLADNFSFDSDGTHLALTGLFSDYAYFSDYLAVEGTLMTNDLYVENNLITSSISSPLDANDQTLYLQPTGTGAINLLAGLLVLDESGTVSLNGNLIVTGTLESGPATISGTLNLRASSLDGNQEATPSGFGRLLSIYNEQGEQVAGINASGSAQFNDLTTRRLIIAAPQDSTPSANQVSTTSNTTIGTATIPAGELTTYIENNHITDTTLIYLTPISDTHNQVLYVKNKYSCPVDAPLSCQPFFTVAINQPTTQDIRFNYWLIQVQ